MIALGSFRFVTCPGFGNLLKPRLAVRVLEEQRLPNKTEAETDPKMRWLEIW